jgi:hypothetical protein
MKAVYVNGHKHKNVSDALLTTGGYRTGMLKAIDCGLRYKGYVVSYEPLEEEEMVQRHYPGLSLIRHPQTTP